ncbi:MAG: hypothetical protein KatS3mg020_0487 [Fimbriimonadales bacterium]|nr:MAG: hypothetical protein KatS3mg020_0487 [Fimbriimonadales bacterium]
MTCIGTVQGNRIELEEPLSFPPGTRVRVIILPVESPSSRRLIGLFHDEAELLDNLLEAVMTDRETRPLRHHDGQSFA